jgi:hypothetical protein
VEPHQPFTVQAAGGHDATTWYGVSPDDYTPVDGPDSNPINCTKYIGYVREYAGAGPVISALAHKRSAIYC